MNSASKDQQAAAPSNKLRVSPELSEFMHMLTALETQLTKTPPQTTNSR